MAAGRAELGDDAALLSRYRVYSAAFALVTLVAILPRVRVVTVTGVTVLVSTWLVVSARTMMPLVANTWYAQEITRATYLATGHGVYVPWPPQEYGDFMLDRAKAMGYFTPQPSRHPLIEPAGTWQLLRCSWEEHS